MVIHIIRKVFQLMALYNFTARLTGATRGSTKSVQNLPLLNTSYAVLPYYCSMTYMNELLHDFENRKLGSLSSSTNSLIPPFLIGLTSTDYSLVSVRLATFFVS